MYHSLDFNYFMIFCDLSNYMLTVAIKLAFPYFKFCAFYYFLIDLIILYDYK